VTHGIFDQHAERYNSWFQRHPVLFECEAKVMRALNLQGKGLAIGVGTGILDSKAHTKIGVDPVLTMLRLASSRGILVIRAVGEHLPFRDGSFDFALMTATICFLESPEEAIQEAKRVLRSEGELVICIVPRDSSWGEDYLKKSEAGNILYRHAHFYTMSELEELLRRFSFKPIAVQATLSYPPSANPNLEEPSENPERKGFICIKAATTSRDNPSQNVSLTKPHISCQA
jgi:ubiquinone/menaquinone biosynthesis C-methylase UbiE